MLDFFARLFDGDFMPHGHCYMWRPAVLWLNVGSDIAIALAYFSIPLALLTFTRKRRDFSYPWLLLLFAGFIVSCGITHLVDVVTTWTGTYRLEGFLKLVTALISVATAVLLWPLIPRLLALPSPSQLAKVNETLRTKIESLELSETVAGVGHWRLDLAEDQLHWSPQVYRIYGKDPSGPSPTVDDALGAFHADDRPRAQQIVGRAIEQGEPFDTELKLERADGAIRYVRAIGRVEPDAATGRAKALFGVFLDVTDEYQRREDLEALVEERTAQLRQANVDLKHFAHAASHDLKEPLRMISSYVSLIERRMGDALDDTGRRYLGYAADGARRMAHLIDDLLSFSRANEAELVFEQVELDALLDEVRTNLRSLLLERGAQIEVEGPLAPVVTVRLAIQQALHNLLSNAAKYGGEQPRIHVGTHRDEDARAWVVTVRDEGSGIAPEDRERIFDPFTRLHGREEVEGSGMGLAICRRLVERCGGRLWVEDSAEGALFSLSIPDRTLHTNNVSAQDADAIGDPEPLL